MTEDIFASTDELIAEYKDMKSKGFVVNKIFMYEECRIINDLKGRLAVFKAWHADIMHRNNFYHTKLVKGYHAEYMLMERIAQQIRRIEEALND